MNKRKQMLTSNSKALEYLLSNDFDQIYLKPHRDTRKKFNHEFIHTKEGKYQITDFFNLFDGFCYDVSGLFYWIQIKTDNWANENEIKKFFTSRYGRVLSINVRKPTKTIKKYRVDVRRLVF